MKRNACRAAIIFIVQLVFASLPALAASPTADSVSPNPAAGLSQTLTFQFSDADGQADISSVQVIIKTEPSYYRSCSFSYGHARNNISLQNDAGTGWGVSANFGSSTVLQNSQCMIDVQNATSTSSGNTLTLSVPITFDSTFVGTRNIYGYAFDMAGNRSGWQTLGTWIIQTPVPGLPSVDAFTPATVVAGVPQTVSFQFSDINQYKYISWVQGIINTQVAYPNSCSVSYGLTNNTINLHNDAGTSSLPTVQLGSTVTLSNSQCSIDVAHSTAVGSGNTLTLNLVVTFNRTFATTKHVYGYAADLANGRSEWQSLGTLSFVPRVEMTSPQNGAIYTLPTPVPINITADQYGRNGSVQFLANGVELFNWTAVPYTAQWTPAPGHYSVEAKATDTNGAVGTAQPAEIDVVIPGGALSNTFNAIDPSIPPEINLTTEGTADWILFAPSDAPYIGPARKTGVAQKISSYRLISEESLGTTCNSGIRFDYQDGIPHSTQREANCAFWLSSSGSGFEITVKADTTPRTLRLYLGTTNARGKLYVSISDYSAPPRISYLQTDRENGEVQKDGFYSITYNAASDDQTLTIRWTVDEQFNPNWGDSYIIGGVKLYAVTLDGSSILTPFTITDVTPASGPIGTHVAITGNGFGDIPGTVTIGNTPMFIQSWSDTRIDARVSPGSQTATLNIQNTTDAVAGPIFTIYEVGGEPQSGYEVFPQNLNMEVGESRTAILKDWNGAQVTGVAWTSSDTSVVDLSTDDPPLIVAIAPGTAIVYALDVPLTVTVYAAGTMPPGTPIWTQPLPGAGSIETIIPAVPSSSNIDVFVKRRDDLVALSSDGDVIWTKNIWGLTQVLPDFSGSAVLKTVYRYYSPNGDFHDTHRAQYMVPDTSNMTDLYTFSDKRTRGECWNQTQQTIKCYDDSDSLQVVIPHPSGVVFIQDNDKITLVNETTSQNIASLELQKSTTIANGNISYEVPTFGKMIVAGDGNAYIPYHYFTTTIISGSDPCTYNNTKISHATMIRISPDGTSANIPIQQQTLTTTGCAPQDQTSSGSYFSPLALTITDADNGVAAFFSYYVGSQSQYTVTFVSHDAAGPTLNIPFYFSPVLQREDGSYIGVTYGNNVVALSPSGAPLWTTLLDGVPSPKYATADGGAIVAAGSTLYTLDKDGNIVSQKADDGGVFSWKGVYRNSQRSGVSDFNTRALSVALANGDTTTTEFDLEFNDSPPDLAPTHAAVAGGNLTGNGFSLAHKTFGLVFCGQGFQINGVWHGGDGPCPNDIPDMNFSYIPAWDEDNNSACTNNVGCASDFSHYYPELADIIKIQALNSYTAAFKNLPVFVRGGIKPEMLYGGNNRVTKFDHTVYVRGDWIRRGQGPRRYTDPSPPSGWTPGDFSKPMSASFVYYLPLMAQAQTELENEYVCENGICTHHFLRPIYPQETARLRELFAGVGRGIGNVSAHETGHQLIVPYMDCDYGNSSTPTICENHYIYVYQYYVTPDWFFNGKIQITWGHDGTCKVQNYLIPGSCGDSK